MAAAPDPLTRAFNDAIRPYQEQIEMLKAEIDDKELQLQHLEDERADMHAWIDKRGLRAGMGILRAGSTASLLIKSRCTTLDRADNEHRLVGSAYPQLSPGPKTGETQYGSPSPAGLCHGSPADVNLLFHTAHSPALDRDTVDITERTAARIRTHSQARW